MCAFLYETALNLIAVIGNRPNLDHTLDRFPVCNGGYTCGSCPECIENGWELNIRWATKADQSENRECVIQYTAFGKTMSLVRWGKFTGINPTTLRYRVKVKGWSMEEALSTPGRKGHSYRGEQT